VATYKLTKDRVSMEKKLNRVIITILFIGSVMPSLATANDCTYWKQQINQVSRWSNNGGNADQQRRLQKQKSYLQSQLAKCQGTTPGPISVARGQPSNTTSYTPINHLSSDNKDAELQQLIATCNRWIDISNNNATFENQSTRDTACRAATNKEALLKNPKHTSEIDHEVKACMQGLKEPDWNATKN
jgi:hypothetical protein